MNIGYICKCECWSENPYSTRKCSCCICSMRMPYYEFSCKRYTAKLANIDTFRFFETVQKVFVFFSELPKRWAIFQKFAAKKKITLKNVSIMRWSSQEAATKWLFYILPAIHAALIEIVNAPKAPGERNRGASMANILAKKIEKFKFICGVVAWHNISSQINNCLQNAAIAFHRHFQWLTTDSESTKFHEDLRRYEKALRLLTNGSKKPNRFKVKLILNQLRSTISQLKIDQTVFKECR